jgi:hypothetical protein
LDRNEGRNPAKSRGKNTGNRNTTRGRTGEKLRGRKRQSQG